MVEPRWNIEVDQIPEDGLDARLSALPSFFDFNQKDVTWRELVEWLGTIQRFGEDVYCRGTARGTIVLPCSRCLKEVTRSLEVETAFSFFAELPPGEEGSDEVEVSSDELDIYLFEDGGVDLRKPVRDSLIMAVPLQSFCYKDCKGLCERCGADLNDGPCGCLPETADPRWEALARLRRPSSTEKG